MPVRPRGLHPYGPDDADFFLDLLPGPRGLFGLPESVGFWRTRIEGVSEKALRLGLIFGASGSGKTSMVLAGLLPRLSARVLSVYAGSTGDDLEAGLLGAIRGRCPGLPDGLDLAEALVAVRKGEGLPGGGKLLLVLDQFERWLGPGRGKSRKALAAALRQCDGEHLQALAVARDDCWVAASRFMRDLDERIVEGGNTAAVEAFDPRHAERVLEAIGRGYRALPEAAADLDDEHRSFLKAAVHRLADGDPILPARLSLFARLVRGKPWDQSTLDWLGDSDPGVRFLETSFRGSSSRAAIRAHRRAVRSVLGAFLHASGPETRGRPRAHRDLLAASGCESRPANFDALMERLVGDLGLVTPVDETGAADRVDASAGAGGLCYRLTSDHLIRPLIAWLADPEVDGWATSSRPSADDGATGPGRPVDLNHATEDELRALPGVGPATARRILEGRPFRAVDDLLRLKGMSRASLARIEAFVEVG